MADQTTVSGRFAARNNGARPAEAFQHSMADFAHDVATLGELQARLLVIDAKETGRRAVMPAVLGVSGLVLLLGSVPIALLGIAYVLHEEAQFSLWSALLLTFAGAVVVTGGLLAGAWALTRRSAWPLKRSQEELSRNLGWVMDVLKRKGTTGARCP
jgi:hypothetical protein